MNAGRWLSIPRVAREIGVPAETVRRWFFFKEGVCPGYAKHFDVSRYARRVYCGNGGGMKTIVNFWSALPTLLELRKRWVRRRTLSDIRAIGVTDAVEPVDDFDDAMEGEPLDFVFSRLSSRADVAFALAEAFGRGQAV